MGVGPGVCQEGPLTPGHTLAKKAGKCLQTARQPPHSHDSMGHEYLGVSEVERKLLVLGRGPEI